MNTTSDQPYEVNQVPKKSDKELLELANSEIKEWQAFRRLVKKRIAKNKEE